MKKTLQFALLFMFALGVQAKSFDLRPTSARQIEMAQWGMGPGPGTAHAVSSCLPYSDSFPGSTLNANWTTPVSGGSPNTITASSGNAVSVTGGGGLAVLTGCGAVGAAQTAQLVIVTKGDYTGPGVHFSPVTGNGYAYLTNLGQIEVITAGSGSATVATGCPANASGDTVKFSVDASNNMTAQDTLTISVTAYAIVANVLTLTASNPLTGTGGGQSITISGFPTSTFLNGTVVTTTAATSTTITVPFTHANASATEAGLVKLTPCTGNDSTYPTGYPAMLIYSGFPVTSFVGSSP